LKGCVFAAEDEDGVVDGEFVGGNSEVGCVFIVFLFLSFWLVLCVSIVETERRKGMDRRQKGQNFWRRGGKKEGKHQGTTYNDPLVAFKFHPWRFLLLHMCRFRFCSRSRRLRPEAAMV